jgi:O-antigen/teichoic acid export membrane protein
LGIIVRQSLKASAVGYIAAVVGVINTFFIYTLCFTESELGQIRFVQDTAILLSGLFSLGVYNIAVRFFPEFKSENKHNGFLGLLLFFFIGGVLLFTILYWLICESLPDEFNENIKVIWLTFSSVILVKILFQYTSNFGRIVVPSLLNNLFVKIGLSLIALYFLNTQLPFDKLLYGVPIIYGAAALGLIIYVGYIKQLKVSFQFSFLTKARIKEILVYAGFGILGTIGSSLATRLDIFMVTDILDYARTGVYAIAFNIANLLMVPTAAIFAISGPIIAGALKKKDMDHVEEIYKKSGLNLFVLGCLLMILIWCNMDEIFEIIPNGERYKSGKIVILLLGLAKLFDMLTSINEYIIAYSKHFRYNLYFLLVLAVVNVVANLTLIPQFELAGAALATLLSVVLFNIFKTYFVYAKFKIHPFQRKIGYTILISIFIVCLNMILPNLDNSWLSIVFKSIVLGGIFVSGVLIFRLSDEANMFWENFKNKLVNK